MRFAGEEPLVFLVTDADAVLPQFIGHQPIRRRMAAIPMNRVNTPQRGRSPRCCAAFGRAFAEIHREIGHDEKVIFFRHAAGLRALYSVMVAYSLRQVHLDDLLNVLIELRETLLDLFALRPDGAD